MLEANKFKLGLFVSFSILAMIAIFIALGVFDAFQPKVRLMTLFKESVQGLENGSPIKFRGVPLGKVSDITIDAKEKLIRVDMEIDMRKVRTGISKDKNYDDGTPAPEQFYSFLDREIAAGLRCRLELAGITGMKYVEIDYMEPEVKACELLAQQGLGSDGFYYIPSTPSLLSGLRTSLTDTLSKIASIDYKKVADEMSAALNSATTVFSDPQLKQLMGSAHRVAKEIEVSARNVNSTFTEERMTRVMDQISEAVNSLDNLARKSREAVEAAEFDKTSAAFREAAKTFMESKQAFEETMMKFNEALDSAIEFINYLDEDPSALIKGKQKESPFERRRKAKEADKSVQ